jgi:hypothetical protein
LASKISGRRALWLTPAVLAALALQQIATRGGQSADDRTANTLAQAHPIAGGPFEASGVAAVAGAEGVLFIDDSQSGAVMWLEIDAEDAQKKAPSAVPLGVDVIDPEGLTTDGKRYLMISSLSRSARGQSMDLVRFRFDPSRGRAEGVEGVRGLQRWLADRVPELRTLGNRSDEAGVNIEGLAWDPSHDRLLLGLRSPLEGGDALVVALKIDEADKPLSLDRLSVDGASLRVPLGGAGIRSIETNGRGGFDLIAAPERGSEFRLVEWSGGSRDAVREIARFPARLKAEGVTRATLHGRPRTVVMFDASAFLVLK